MQPSDLAKLRVPSDPRIHPNGDRVAFVVSVPDVKDDTYRRSVHVWTPQDGDQQLTHGPKDGLPRWSPDGSRLAFLRTGPGKKERPQLAVMRIDGGEATVVTDLPLGVTDLAWAPDSRRLAVVGAEWIPELADLDDDERSRRPRRVTGMPYRFDDEGWVRDQRSHIWIVDPDGDEEPRCLTPGDYDETFPAFRPDGQRLVFVSRRRDDREVHPGEELYEIDVDGGDAELLCGGGWWERPVCLDADRLLIAGLGDAFDWPTPQRLYMHDRGAGLTDLSEGLDRDIVAPNGAAVTPDGYLAIVHDRGRARIQRFTDDGPDAIVADDDRVVTGLSAAGGAVAYAVTSCADPGEVWLRTGGNEQQLTTLNAELRDSGAVVPTEHFTYERDGTELDAWLLMPPDADDDVPLLLNIHGGPTAQYGFEFFDEFQVYASAGYAVVGINPRGSSGRGHDWARAVVGTWTDLDSPDMLDLEAAVDAALDHDDRISRDCIGVMGGSYGGFATARLLARSDRFRSAVVERALLNWLSFGGTSDIGPFFDRMFVAATLPNDAAELWAASPMSQAHRITTPTLIIHSEHDWRCPIEQGEQLFTMLRRHGVDTEMLRFPDESHELSRSGSPKHRVERFEAILDWHGRYLR